MKRLVPFIIIALVALATVTSALLFYRSKMQQPLTPRPPVVAAATPAGSAGAGSSTTPATNTAAATPKEDQSLHIRGPRDAPVTMEVYGDFQCPSCGFASKIIRQLEEDYPQQLRVIFYEFPLAMHAHAVDAARAAEAASLQGKFWEMHDQLYEYQAVWSKASDVHFFFENYAEAIGIDVARFRADSQSADVQQAVISQGQAGAARGVQNTPTIFINGHMLRAEFSREKFDDAIKAALAAKGKS